jgi:esterase/lipase superfamily enzyme
MGALVLMEALRSLALAGSEAFFAKLQAVVLMAPDLDIDVFRGQVAPLAARGVPIYIFFSSNDRALRFSSLLRGDSERLGSIRDLQRLDGLPVTLIETSEVNDGQDALGHFAVATSPAMISLIQGMDAVGAEIFVDAANSPNPVEATINVFQGVGDAVFSPLAP